MLVTGADGFVGSRLVPRLAAEGHAVTAAIRRGTRAPAGAVDVVELELRDQSSVDAVAATRHDAVVHLAAVASGAEARRDPGTAWEVNTVGTVRLGEALARAAGDAPLLLFVSSGEVYGDGPAPRRETDVPWPASPYAASKLAAEIALQEISRRSGLRLIVARPFPHTGAGQDARFVVPAFARRLLDARARAVDTVPVGNLAVVRDFLHVDDVVDAYVRLLRDGRAGEVYNVASGEAVAIADVFDRLARAVGVRARPVPDPTLVRPSDLPRLVGDAAKLRDHTGWRPRRTLDEVLAEVIGAQAN